MLYDTEAAALKAAREMAKASGLKVRWTYKAEQVVFAGAGVYRAEAHCARYRIEIYEHSNTVRFVLGGRGIYDSTLKSAMARVSRVIGKEHRAAAAKQREFRRLLALHGKGKRA